jgi:hypothetical protein
MSIGIDTVHRHCVILVVLWPSNPIPLAVAGPRRVNGVDLPKIRPQFAVTVEFYDNSSYRFFRP